MEGTPWVGMTGPTVEGNTVGWDDGNNSGRDIVGWDNRNNNGRDTVGWDDGNNNGRDTVGWDDGNSNGRGNVLLQLLFYIVSVGVSVVAWFLIGHHPSYWYYNLRQPAR